MEEYEELIKQRNELLKKENILRNNRIVRDYYRLCAKVKGLEYKISKEKDKEKQKELSDKKDKAFGKVKLLKRNPVVKDYLEVQEELTKKNKKIKELEKNNKKVEYNKCNHIFIGDEENAYCLNCGLDSSVLNYDISDLNEQQRIMYEYLFENDVDTTDVIECDLELGKSVYKRIKEERPEIDDVLVRRCLEKTINDIKKDENKRAKRLTFNPNN